MFDETTKIILFSIGMAAWVFTLAAEKEAPPAEMATSVNVSQLPALPLTAALDGSPAQTDVSETRVALNDGFEATLLFGYVLEGRVVTRREFRHSLASAISPLDLGIVWGELAEPGGTDRITFKTGHRRIRFRPVPGEGPHLIDDWQDRVTNNHLIPANQQLRDKLMSIEVGTQVRIRGYLVEVTGDTIRPWRSSTTRDDGSAIAGCEIILVTGVEVIAGDEVAAVAPATGRARPNVDFAIQ